jgi:ABC-type Zn uptake system ZnuABC Zn-binding protein ZnuA
MEMRTILIGCSLALVASGVAGCGGGSDDSGGDGPTVVTTTGIVADITEQVAGEDAVVEQLIPDGASPHDFQLSATARLDLERADLVIDNGAGLEATIPLDDLEGERWTLADHVETLPFADGGSDPHVWMDPTRVAAALPSLAEALSAADPAHARDYDRRAADYAKQLGELDHELRRTLSAVPAGERELITSHDSLGYLADRYGFEVVATAFPASGPEGEVSAGQLAEIGEAIAAREVGAVFAGEEDDPEALRQVADDAGVTVIDDLAIESPGENGSYEQMLRHDGERIAAALAP